MPLSSLTPALSSLPLSFSSSCRLPFLSPSHSLPEVAQRGRPPSPLPLPPSRSTTGPWRGRRRAGQRHGLAGPSSSSFPLSLSPVVVAHGARARCRWVSAVPRLAQSSLRCSCFLFVFWDFAFASLIRPFYDFDSCSRVWRDLARRGVVGTSGRRPRLRRLSRKRRRHCLGAPLGSCVRIGAVRVSGRRRRTERGRLFVSRVGSHPKWVTRLRRLLELVKHG